MATAADDTGLPKSVLVSDIPDDCNYRVLLMFLKNKRKSGGGGILEHKLVPEEGLAVITYKEAEVTERVLQKQYLDFEGHKLKVTEIPPHRWDKVTIQVTFSGYIDQNELELLFEDKEQSGGGTIQKLDIEDNKAIITYEEEEDATDVLTHGSFDYEGTSFTVQKPPRSLPDTWDGKTVIVTGVTDISKDNLELFYEDADESGGGAIEAVTLDEKDHIASIIFENREDAESVLKKKTVKHEGHIFTAEKPSRKKKGNMQPSKKPGPDKENDEQSNNELTNKTACRFFLRGNCQKGNQCRFIHDLDTLPWDQVTVDITGFPKGTDTGVLELLYEDKDKTGGGPIQSCTFDDVHLKATLVFKEKEDADAVLQKSEYKWKEYTLKADIPKPSESVWNGKTLVVTGLATRMTEDVLELLFDDTKIGGGPLEEIILDPDTNTATITFEDETNAAAVLKNGPITYKKTTLNVSIPEVEAVFESWDGVTVRIAGFPKDTSEDVLEIIYEKCGGPIQSIVMSSDGLSAMVSFENKRDAETVIEMKVEKWRDHTLSAVKHESKDGPVGSVEDCIFVAGVSKEKHEETLSLLFENTGKTGGGPILSTEWGRNNTAVVIQFQDVKTAKSVVQKHTSAPIAIRGIVFEIQKCSHEGGIELLQATEVSPDIPHQTNKETRKQLQLQSCGIIVSNIPRDTPTFDVEMFFEVEGDSGGGAIEDMVHLQDDGRAYITYESHQVANRVQQKYVKEGVNFLGVKVKITLQKPKCDEIQITDDTDMQRLCLQNLPDDIELSDVKQYLERIQGCRVENIYFGVVPGAAVIHFAKFPGHDLLYETACQKPLKTNMIKIEGVNKTVEIEVYGAESFNIQKVRTYFGHRSSNGRDVVDASKASDENVIILTFKEHQVAMDVCKKQDHKLDDMPLRVMPHYSCIGLARGTDGTSPFMKLPDDIVVEIPHPCLMFVYNRNDIKQQVEKEMFELATEVTWATQSSSEVVLKYLPKIASQQQINPKHWPEVVQENLKDFFTLYNSKSIDIPEEAWGEFVERFEAVKLDGSNLEASLQRNSASVEIVGQKEAVNNFAMRINEINQEILEEIQKQKDIITKSVKLPTYKVQLLQLCGVIKNFQQQFPNVHIQLEDELGVKLTGHKEEIQEMKDDIQQEVVKMCSESIEMAQTTFKLLRGNSVREYIQTKLDEAKVKVIWELEENNQIGVHAMDRRDLSKATKILRSCVIEKEIPLTATHAGLIGTERWTEFQSSMHDRYSRKLLLSIVGSMDSFVQVICCDDIHEEANSTVKRFLDNNSILCKVHPMILAKVEYIDAYLKQELTDMENKCRIPYRLKLDLNKIGPNTGFNLECNNEGMKAMKKFLQELDAKIKSSDHQVTTPGMATYFSSSKGQLFLQGLGFRHKVVIKVNEEIEEGSEYVDVAQETNVVKTEVTFPNGKKLYIMLGDLTTMTVDAIVNAGDVFLRHGGGVAKAIVDSGGEIIQSECTEYIERHGSLLPGQVYVSTAGNLKCKKIIHTVGPKWRGGKFKEDDDLYKAVYQPLEKAGELKFTTVSMPAISTGKYGFPINLACEILVGTIGSFLADTQLPVQEIYLVDQNAVVLQACQDALYKSAGHGIKIDDKDNTTTSQYNQGATASILGATGWSTGTAGNQMNTVEGISVNLMHGSITDQTVNVIVNTTNNTLDLSQGMVSNIILKMAGQEIQRQCHKKVPKGGVPNAKVTVTTSGKVKRWKEIYHGALPFYSNVGKSTALKDLGEYVRNCLREADSNNIHSIAFPSLGTGNLGYPPEDVAEVMFATVVQFSKQKKHTSVKEIIFVIFDNTIHQIFEDHMRTLSPSTPFESAMGFPGTTEEKPLKGVTKGPKWIEVSVPHEIKTCEDVVVRIISGKLADQKVDALINLTSSTLDLNNGAVSKSILSAAGPSIQAECLKLKPNGIIPGKICVTTGGNLTVQCIFHGTCSQYGSNGEKEMQQTISVCLQKAHKRKLKSIAFPSLGTGSLGFTPVRSATLMFEGVYEFSKANPQTTLKNIYFVLFDAPIKKAFEAISGQLAVKVVQGTRRRQLHSEVVKPKQQDGYMSAVKNKLKTAWNYMKPGSVSEQNTGTKETNFRIYGVEIFSIKEAIKEIESICEDEVDKRPINDEAIEKLTNEQIEHIMAMEHSLDIEISIQKQEKRIDIHGPGKDVSEAVSKIYKIFKEMDEREKDNLINRVQWKYNDDGFMEDYPANINAIIEKAKKDGKRSVSWGEVEENGDKIDITIDFKNMEETCSQRGHRIKVQRIIEVDPAGVKFPPTWDKMLDAANYIMVPLKGGCSEFNDVKKNFDTSMKAKGATYSSIEKIERVQNTLLFSNYTAHKEHMKKTNPNTTNPYERTLWHATQQNVLAEINANGFNRSFSGLAHGAWYGKGVYFATEAGLSAKSYSGQSGGDKYIFQCKVLTGDFTQVPQQRNLSQASLTAPPKDPKNPSIKFDSVVDNATSPNEWVIFTDAQAYPEYIITFQI